MDSSSTISSKLDTSAIMSMYDKTRGIGNRDILNKDDAALKKQTDAFESFIIKIFLDAAMPNKDSDSALFPKVAGANIYRSMYREKLSESLGGGIGFSKLMFDYLKRQRDGQLKHIPTNKTYQAYNS